MPPQTPKRNIKVIKKQITPSKRGRIAGRRLSGQKFIDIAKAEKRLLAVLYIGNLDLAVPNALLIDKNGKIIRTIRLNPKWTYSKVISGLNLPIKHDVIYRLLKEYRIRKWRAKKRPLLTAEIAKIRLDWCKERRHWGTAQWLKVIWSDECFVELGSGSQREWVFRTPEQKRDKETIQPYPKGNLGSIMVWGAFWCKWKSDLVRMARDQSAKKKGYSSESYLGVLEDQLPTIYQYSLIFMQDNAPIHKARKIIEWFKDHGMDILQWPPYSPDLNPIEHLWRKLKEITFELKPQRKTSPQSLEDKLDELYETLERAWHTIGKDLMKKLVRSMQRRVKAVIKAKGWYTK